MHQNDQRDSTNMPTPDTIWCVFNPDGRLVFTRIRGVETALAVTEAALVPEMTELAKMVATEHGVTLKVVEFSYCRAQEIAP